jgi:hypothetical protein
MNSLASAAKDAVRYLMLAGRWPVHFYGCGHREKTSFYGKESNRWRIAAPAMDGFP